MRYDKDKDAYIITTDEDRAKLETAKAGYALGRECILGLIMGCILAIIHAIIKIYFTGHL